jgi:hypothetical protein
MLIGVDLDHTIINYRESLAHCAALLFPEVVFSNSDKNTVKETLLLRPNGMQQWMRLQGMLYSVGLKWAIPYAGVKQSFKTLQEEGHDIVIVSHKTERGHFDESGAHLHQVALAWLEQQEIVDSSSGIEVNFCLTQSEKLIKIKKLACDVFVDDLVEVLQHSDFQKTTQPIHFAADVVSPVSNQMLSCKGWSEVTDAITRFVH